MLALSSREVFVFRAKTRQQFSTEGYYFSPVINEFGLSAVETSGPEGPVVVKEARGSALAGCLVVWVSLGRWVAGSLDSLACFA